MIASRAAAVAAAIVLDRLIPEPPNQLHPVAWFGAAMTAFERRIWADDRRQGVAYAAVGTCIGLAAGSGVRSTTVALTIALGAGGLRDVAGKIYEVLAANDLAAAKQLLPWLVGRDPTDLDASGVAAAVIESLAENSVDASVAPVFWALLAGAPGVLAYRAINTMDAMVGHRSPRFENFGWASARLDDLANLLPARVFAALVLLAAPDRRVEIVRSVREDGAQHPSPNAGVAESAVAGALGIELGGTLHYGDRAENRPLLGRGPRPGHHSIADAITLTDRVQAAMATGLAATAIARRLRRR